MNTAINELPQNIPIARACDALGLSRSTVYHRKSRKCHNAEQLSEARSREHCKQHRALSPAEREAVLEVLNSEEFVDQPPMQVYHTLLERGDGRRPNRAYGSVSSRVPAPSPPGIYS